MASFTYKPTQIEETGRVWVPIVCLCSYDIQRKLWLVACSRDSRLAFDGYDAQRKGEFMRMEHRRPCMHACSKK